MGDFTVIVFAALSPSLLTREDSSSGWCQWKAGTRPCCWAVLELLPSKKQIWFVQGITHLWAACEVSMQSWAQFPTLYQIALYPTVMCEILAVEGCLQGICCRLQNVDISRGALVHSHCINLAVTLILWIWSLIIPRPKLTWLSFIVLPWELRLPVPHAVQAGWQW